MSQGLLQIKRTKPSGAVSSTLLMMDAKVLFRTTPLSLVSVDADGKVVIDKSVVLDTREKALPGIDPSRPFKLNAGTSGVCSYSFKLIGRFLITTHDSPPQSQTGFFTLPSGLRVSQQKQPRAMMCSL